MKRQQTLSEVQRVHGELARLRARYDDGAISLAIYAVVKKLEGDIAWAEHRECGRD
jgi:hypothetical protein